MLCLYPMGFYGYDRISFMVMTSDSLPAFFAQHDAFPEPLMIFCLTLFPLTIMYSFQKYLKIGKTRKIQVSLVTLLVLIGVYLLAGLVDLMFTNQSATLVIKGMAAGACLSAALAIGFILPRHHKVSAASPAEPTDPELMAIEEEALAQQTNLEELVRLRTQDLADASRKLQDKIHEQQASQSQIQFQASLLDQVKSAIVTTDMAYNITYWNKQAEQLFGWKRHELIGKPILDVTTKKKTRKIGEAFLNRLRKRKSFSGEVKIPHKNGRYIHLEVDCTPVYNTDRQQIGFVAVAVDMTRHVKYENQLQNEKEQAEQLALARQDFLSTMSHEIRTPLNVVIGMTRLLRENYPRHDQQEYLKSLQFSANHLLTIINDILDMAKIEAGKIKLEKADFNIDEVLDGMLKAFAVKAREKGLEFSIDAEEDVPRWLVGDQVRLTQILSNLLSNAIKFTKDGFVCIKLRARQRSENVCRIHFEVMDSGIGISQDKLEKIFDRFTQAKEDTTRRFGGSGLGLSICKKLVQLQGGEISVKSEEGVGSTFSFSIDYELSREDHQVAESQSYTSYPLENVRLLLVDDDEANCIVANSFLQKMGVKKVTTATNGEEAVRIVQELPFDIVLMDLQMPIMNGYEATQAIRTLGGIYQDLPIIALTADVVSDVREKVIKAGMNDYISKPFDPDELNAIIARHLNIASQPSERPAEAPAEELFTLRQILEKYHDDNQFTQALLTSVQNSYKELSQQVEDAVSEWDVITLRRTIHKMQPTLKMMQNYQLQENLFLLRELLSQKTANEKQLNILTGKIHDLTQKSLKALEELTLEVNDQKTKVM